MSTQIKSLADALHYHRSRLGLNQTDAAAKVGRTQQVWSRWEAGVMMPPLHLLPDIAKLCGMDPGELMQLAARDQKKIKKKGPQPARKNRIEQLEQMVADQQAELARLREQVETQADPKARRN